MQAVQPGQFRPRTPPRILRPKHTRCRRISRRPRQSGPLLSVVVRCPKPSLSPGERSFTDEACATKRSLDSYLL